MKTLLSYLLTPIFYLCFGLLLIIFDPIQRICLRIGGYKTHKKSVDILNFFLQACQYLLLNSVQFTSEVQLPTNQPIIFCANHQSMFDIPALIWFLRKHHAKFISKIELTKNIPSISYNLLKGGGANINRKDNKQSLVEIIKLGKRMKQNNWSTVIFPEGTRSKTGTLKTFQLGGVSALLKSIPDALIVPVVIQNSWKIVQKGNFPLGTCLKLSWTTLAPIQKGDTSPEEIVQKIEQTIRTRLQQTNP